MGSAVDGGDRFVRKLRQTVERIQRTRDVSRNDLFKVLVDSRQVLESTGEKSQYPQLMLFLNWSLHPDIRHMAAGHRLLLELSRGCAEAIRDLGDEQANREITRTFIRQVENAIDIPRLRSEFISLFTRHSIPTFLMDTKSNWDALVRVIIEEIMEKPLSFPSEDLEASLSASVGTRDSQALRILRRIRSIDPKRPVAQVLSLRVTEGSSGFAGVYCVELTTATRVTYVMQLKGIEQASAFGGH